MRQITFWKCNPSVSAEIIESWKDWQAKVAKAQKIAKSIGAVCAYFSQSFNAPFVSGFKFKEPPAKGFKKLKGTTDGYAPRSGTELEKELNDLRCDAVDVAAKATGIDRFGSDEDVGLVLTGIGMSIQGKTVYLSTRGTPKKGCKRISDLEFDKKCGQRKGKRTGHS